MSYASPAYIVLASVIAFVTGAAVAGCTGTLRSTAVFDDDCFNGTFANDDLLVILVERQGVVAGSGVLFASPRRTVELIGFVQRPGEASVRVVVRSLPPQAPEAHDLGSNLLQTSRVDSRCGDVLFAFGIDPEAGPFEILERWQP